MTETLADLYEARFGEATDLGKDRSAEGEIARQLAHRSHRRWADKPVDDDLLQLLFAAALSIPTKSDLMQYAVLHVEDQAKKDRVAKLIPSMADRGCAVFLLCGDGRRIRKVCELRGTDFAHEEIDSFFNPTVDAALAFCLHSGGRGRRTCDLPDQCRAGADNRNFRDAGITEICSSGRRALCRLSGLGTLGEPAFAAPGDGAQGPL